MLNISELTAKYIEYTYSPELQKTILSSFTLLELFGYTYYEDRYTDLISRYDTITNDDKQLIFTKFLREDIGKIITEHQVSLDYEMDISLTELNEIAHFLYLIQHLEDYSEVIYILHSDSTPRIAFIRVVSRLTTLSEVRLLEIINNVSETLVDGLRNFILDRENELVEPIDVSHRKHVQRFFKFIEDTPCLGRTLYESGYQNVKLTELINLLPYNISDRVDEKMITSAPEAALEVLSLLIITTDDYQLPIFKFNRNTSYFTAKLQHVTRLETIMLSILNDFNAFSNAIDDAEKSS
jgi:hypothetical protein